MEIKKVFCIGCNDLVVPYIGQRLTERNIFIVPSCGKRSPGDRKIEKTISFYEFYAYCPVCGEEYLISEAHDGNLGYVVSEKNRLRNNTCDRPYLSKSSLNQYRGATIRSDADDITQYDGKVVTAIREMTPKEYDRNLLKNDREFAVSRMFDATIQGGKHVQVFDSELVLPEKA